MTLLDNAAMRRIQTIETTTDEQRSALAQHLTPKETAQLAASMFSSSSKPLSCLDLGAGTGMLSIALAERYESKIAHIECVEMDELLASICDEELKDYPHRMIVGDALVDTPKAEYDRVILNPPYKKMASDDYRQALLPVHSANLYSAFLAIAISRLSENGECVAIIPRSWMNGDYFTLFRKWVLSQCSLDALHVYDSRTEVFKDTKVLQETMLVRFSKKPQVPVIEVGLSDGKSSQISKSVFAADELITGSDSIIRIAPAKDVFSKTVLSNGFCPSTGKVVDFRSRERIYSTKEEAVEDSANPGDVYRLVYVGNLRAGSLEHPANIGKGQWYRADDKSSRQQLTQPGAYVVVKRFSSKEEARRVVAYPVELTEAVAFENHSNFIHAGTPRNVIPLPSFGLACGLALWLNSTYIDEWFRDVSGSTQVNARDIKAMPCPPITQLTALGNEWVPNMEQQRIDEMVGRLL